MKRRKIDRGIISFLTFVLLVNPFFIASGQDKEETRDFSFWTVGNDGYKQRFGANSTIVLSDIQENKEDFSSLLLCLSDGPKSFDDILAQTGICEDWLRQTITILSTFRFIGVNDNSEYFVRVPVMTDQKMKTLQQSLKPVAHKIGLYIEKEMSDVRRIYNSGKTTSDPSWEDIAHLVIDKLLVDGYFHGGLAALEREGGFKKYYSERQKMIPAFFIESGSEYGTFGVNWYGLKSSDLKRDVYVLHGGLFKRFSIEFNKFRGDTNMTEAIFSLSRDGSLYGLTADQIINFNQLGWINGDHFMVPMVDINSMKVFKEEIDRIGNDAAAIVFDNFDVILDSYSKSTESGYMDGAGDYIQVCYHLLFSGIIKELIGLGTLSPVPEPVPDYFGVFITIGNFWD